MSLTRAPKTSQGVRDLNDYVRNPAGVSGVTLLLLAGAAVFYAYRKGYLSQIGIAGPVVPVIDPNTGTPITDGNGNTVVTTTPTWGSTPRLPGGYVSPVATRTVSVWNPVYTTGAAGGTPGGGTTRGSRNPAELKGFGGYEIDNSAARLADHMQQQAHFSRPGDRSGRARRVRRRR